MPKDYSNYTDFATKLIHTYDDTNVTWSVGVNVGYSGGPTGGLTFGLTGSNVGKSFQLYADNSTIF